MRDDLLDELADVIITGAGRAIAVLAFATGAMGLCLGGLGLVIVAFAQAGHDPVAVAWRRQRHGGPGTPRLSCCR